MNQAQALRRVPRLPSITGCGLPRLGIAFPLIGSALYAVKLLSASPVYFLVATYVLCNVPRVTHLTISRQHLSIFLYTCMFIFYISFLALVGVVQGYKGLFLPTYVNMLLGLSMILIFLPGCDAIDREMLANRSRIGLYGIIVVNAVDTVARFGNPGAPTYEHLQIINDNPDLWFYKYKFGGFMFGDSNQNGILLVAALCLALAILHFTGRGKIAVFLCVALLAATFSRAAWMAGAAVVFLRLLISRPIAFRMVVACILGASVSALLSTTLLSDSSFLVKVNIVRETIEAMTRHPQVFLFGVGLGQSTSLLGVYGHVLPVTALIESGAVGLLIYSIILALFFVQGGYFVKIYITTVFLVAGFSCLIYLGAPCVFLPLIIIYILENGKFRGVAYG